MSNETNVTCDYTALSKEQKNFLKEYTWWTEILGNLSVGVIGLVLNSTAIVVLSTPSMRNNFFNRLLICLAISDSLYLSCEIFEVWRHQQYTSIMQHIFVNVVYPFRSVFMFCSIYLTVALTLERFQAITSPVQYRIRETASLSKRLLYYVVPVLGFSVMYYIPKYFDLYVGQTTKCINGSAITVIRDTATLNYTMINQENCTTGYHLRATTLRTNHHYVFW